MTSFTTVNRIWISYLFEIKRALSLKFATKHRDKSEYFSGYGRDVLSANSGNVKLAEMILRGNPFCVARLGAQESNAIKWFLKKKAYLTRHIRQKEIHLLHNNAGFFPPHEEAVEQYAQTILDLMPEVDLYACWNTSMERYYVRNCLKDEAVLAYYLLLEPYYHENPWSAALAGKKILVIHPFAGTIEAQYRKRNKLFEKKEILPDFELKTLKAVQTCAGQSCEYSSWFDAMEHMYQRAMSIEFDVAIIGCGAYAFPLACKLKKSGRSAITICGPTQILFGIRGSRWDNHPIISKLYNSEWVSASPQETPAQYQKVEGGCYW